MPSNVEPPKKPDPAKAVPQKVVAVSCRARLRTKNGCGSQQSRVVREVKLGMGGRLIQYVCVDCNRPFQITF
jgi:hypothetical protein